MWLWVIHKNYRPYGFVPVLRSKLPLNWELFSQPWLSQVPVTSISDTVAIHVCVSGEYHDRIDILWLSTSWGVVFTLSNCIQVCQLIVWSSWVACCVLLCLLIIGLFSCGVCQPVLHATLCTSSLPGEVFVSYCNCYCYECLMKTMLVVLVSKCQTLVQIVFTGGRTLRGSADMGRTLRQSIDQRQKFANSVGKPSLTPFWNPILWGVPPRSLMGHGRWQGDWVTLWYAVIYGSPAGDKYW